MVVHHNYPILSNHFRKDWKKRVKTHFDQPHKKAARRAARAAKAAAVAPRPLDLLRPVVRCPTLRYNRKVRAGRGFTVDELKAVGFTPKTAPTVGIAVDLRRKNHSVETFELNVARLKEYKERLIILPKRKTRQQEIDNVVKQGVVSSTADSFAIDAKQKKVELKAVSSVATSDAWKTLRTLRRELRKAGKQQEEEE